MAWALRRHDIAPIRRAWHVDRRWALALTVALFPVVFILDETVEASISPVLPGLLVLLLLWITAPYAAMEVRARRPAPDPARLERIDLSSKYALGLASAWFLLWLVFG